MATRLTVTVQLAGIGLTGWLVKVWNTLHSKFISNKPWYLCIFFFLLCTFWFWQYIKIFNTKLNKKSMYLGICEIHFLSYFYSYFARNLWYNWLKKTLKLLLVIKKKLFFENFCNFQNIVSIFLKF